MRIGQTSLVVFVSTIVGSAMGFLTTVYFARVLGAEVLGIYAFVLAVVMWLKITSGAGLRDALTKRISEGDSAGKHLGAGLILLTALGLVCAVVLVIGREYVEMYIDGSSEDMAISVVWFVVVILLVELGRDIVTAILAGERLVHVAGLLNPVQIGIRSTVQLVLVLLGAQLAGLLFGYVAGTLLVGLVGLYFVSVRPRWPARQHVSSLVEYAKYAWINNLKGRAFNDVDIFVLGIFVQPTFVGVYSIAWSLSKFIDLFSSAVGNTVFPEISSESAQENTETTRAYIEDAVSYAGFIALPGFVGGTLLSDRLLQIYGEEFAVGTNVLWILLLSITIFGYTRQLSNALDAIDRPDLTFRVNVAFIGTNLVGNVVLVWQFNWVGAAVASALASTLGLVLAYVLLRRVLTFSPHYGQIGRQIIAAAGMGVVVWSLRRLVESSDIPDHNVLLVVGLVLIGAGVYVLLLLALSSKFRTMVDRNLPIDIPVNP